jgi:hypothetical protein
LGTVRNNLAFFAKLRKAILKGQRLHAGECRSDAEIEHDARFNGGGLCKVEVHRVLCCTVNLSMEVLILESNSTKA